MLELTQCLCPWVNPATAILLVTIQQRRAAALKKIKSNLPNCRATCLLCCTQMKYI